MKRKKKPKIKPRKKIIRSSQYFVYIVLTKIGTYYTGYTHDLKNRLKLHNTGHGAKYLKGKTPVKLVYKKEYKYYKCALNNERKIKMLSRPQKEKLINSCKIKKI